MSYFTNVILVKKNPSEIFPIWKLASSLTNDEVANLKETVRISFESSVFSRGFCDDLCLLCAIYWQRVYSGGSHQYDEILTWAGISTDFHSQFERVLRKYLGNCDLHVDIYNSGQVNRYLDSALVQGGLPMSFTRDLERNGQLQDTIKHFLLNLVEHYSDIVTPNWKDIKYVQQRAERTFQSAICQTEAFCSFALKLTYDIVRDEDNPNYPGLINICRSVREEHRQRRNEMFSVEWNIVKTNGQFIIQYSLEIPQTLSVENYENEDPVLAFYLKEECVAQYYRQEAKYHLMPGYGGYANKTWTENEGLLILTDSKGKPAHLMSAYPQTFDEPFVAYYKDGYRWGLEKGDLDHVAVICPEGWRITNTSDGISDERLTLNGNSYRWFEIEWNNIDLNTESLEFCQDDDVFKVKRNPTRYKINYELDPLHWIEYSDKLISYNVRDYKEKFIIRNEDNSFVRNENEIQIEYRQRGQRYQPYTSVDEIENGPISVRVNYDGYSKTFHFYNVKGLVYQKHGNRSFKFRCESPDVSIDMLTAETDGVYDRETGIYTLNEGANAFPPVKFRLTNGGTDSVDIHISCPARQNGFFDKDYVRIGNGGEVAFDELKSTYMYLNNIDLDDPNTEIGLSLLAVDPDVRVRYFKYRLNNSVVNESLFSVNRFSEIYDMIKCLYGNHDNSTLLRLKIENRPDGRTPIRNYIRIKRYCYYSKQTGVRTFSIERNNRFVPEKAALLKAIPVDIYDRQYNREFDIEERDGHYEIVIPENFRTDGLDENINFVVFSIDRHFSMKPLFINHNYTPIDINGDDNLIYQDLEDVGADYIEDYKQKLLEADTSDDIWEYMQFNLKIVRKYQLWYDTFYSLMAIAESWKLQVKFLLSNYNGELGELERMEMNLGFSFHSIPRNIINDYLISKYGDILVANPAAFMRLCDILLAPYKDILVRQFGESDGQWLYNQLKVNDRREENYNTIDLYSYVERNANLMSHICKFEKLDDEVITNDNLIRYPDVYDDKYEYMYYVPFCMAYIMKGRDVPNNIPIGRMRYLNRLCNFFRIYTKDTYNELFLRQYKYNRL